MFNLNCSRVSKEKTSGKKPLSLKLAMGILIIAVALLLPGCAWLAEKKPIFPQPDITRKERINLFLKKYGPGWVFKWNETTDTPQRISGGTISVQKKINKKNLEELSLAFIEENNFILKTNLKELSLLSLDHDAPKSSKTQTDTWFISFQQTYRGIPVWNSSVRLIYKNNQIVTIGSVFYPDIKLYIKPRITEKRAIRIAHDSLGLKKIKSVPGISLIVFPNDKQKKLTYHLAWKVVMYVTRDPEQQYVIINGKEIPVDQSLKQWVLFIDAHSGKVIHQYDAMEYEKINGTVWGMVYLTTPDQSQTPLSIAHQNISISQGGITLESINTDINGNYTSSDTLTGSVELTAQMRGPHAEVYNEENPDPDATHLSGTVAVPATHDWNWTNDDISPDDVETNSFYHTNIIHDWFLRDATFDVEPDPHPMPVFVRIGEGCNAMAGPGGLLFYSGSSGSCLDFALSADIIYHEFTHRIVHKVYDNLGIYLPYSGFQGAMNEAWADYFGCSYTDDSWHGEVIYSGRNIDTGEYHGLLPVDDNRRYVRDWVGEVHWDSLILSGALWDTRNVLGAAYTDDLAMRTMKHGTENFSEYLEALLMEDDDNTDLSDGSPNIDTICNNFYDKHGIGHSTCAGHTETPIAEITVPSPLEFNLFDGTVTSIVIEGMANGTISSPLQSYVLEFERFDNPGTWNTTGMSLSGSGTNPVLNDVLGQWDITTIADGGYNVRLTVVAADASTASFSTTIIIDSMIMAGWPQQVSSHFYASPVSWDIDTGYPGREVIAAGGGYLYAWHNDGTLMVGWPQYVGWARSSPAVGDLDRDGDYEIIIGSHYSTYVYAFHHDGTAVEGWPMSTGGYVYATPALGDLDGDGFLEVVAGSLDGKIYVWKHDGTILSGWPQDTDDSIKVSAALGDVDNNGSLNVVVGSEDQKVYVWESDGTVLAGWPQSTSDVISTSPVLGDLDNDGDLEIITGSKDKKLYVWHHDGSQFPGWPQSLTQFMIYPSSPALGDIDNDGNLEIIAMPNDNKLSVWEHNGTVVSGFPPVDGPGFLGYEFYVSSPIVGDLDGDQDQEILVQGAGLPSKIFAFHHNGSSVNNWPRFLNMYDNPSPAMDDLDRDGDMEIFVGSNGIFIWDLTDMVSLDDLEWQFYRNDTWRTGLYGFSPPHTVYVDGANGNDANNGLTPLDEGNGYGPKRTIQACIDATPVQGTCLVMPGTYNETVTLKKGVFLRGSNPESTIIDLGGGSGPAVITADDSAVIGFTIQNVGAAGFPTGAAVYCEGTSPLIAHNIIKDISLYPIFVRNANPIIRHNTITGSGNNGIYNSHNSGAFIHNNVIYNCDDSGIYCLLTTDSLKIVNNTIEDNGFGINVQHGSSGSVVGNNIIVNNNVGIYVYNQVPDILFNDVWNNATNYSPNVAGTGDICLDPQFVNLGAHDYHLTSGSPCINAGTDMGLPYNGAAPDIGAFEY